MSEQVIESSDNSIEARLQQVAPHFPYPPTPNIAGSVRRQLTAKSTGTKWPARRLAWAAAIVLLILAGLWSVPQVRAAVVEFLQLGAVRIFLAEPTPTPTPRSPTAAPAASSTPTPVASLLNLAGETTLAQARAQVDFPIHLVPNLGPPDAVFVQNLNGPVVVLVWLEPDRPEQVHLSLHQLGSDALVKKVQPEVIEETTVNGQPALWTEGPYLLQLKNRDYDLQRLVEGHVLIWTEGEITYRLESNLSLAEATRIAESLR